MRTNDVFSAGKVFGEITENCFFVKLSIMDATQLYLFS